MDPSKGQAGVKSVHSRSSDTCGAGNGLWDRSHEKVGGRGERTGRIRGPSGGVRPAPQRPEAVGGL